MYSTYTSCHVYLSGQNASVVGFFSAMTYCAVFLGCSSFCTTDSTVSGSNPHICQDVLTLLIQNSFHLTMNHPCSATHIQHGASLHFQGSKMELYWWSLNHLELESLSSINLYIYIYIICMYIYMYM